MEFMVLEGTAKLKSICGSYDELKVDVSYLMTR